MHPPPPPLQVDIRYAQVDCLQDSQVKKRCLDLLDADERAAWGRFSVPWAQNSYLLAHALCRLALSEHGPCPPEHWRFRPALGGKPEISEPSEARGLQFNISHCRSMVCVAISWQPVGVDVEELSRALEVGKLAPRVLSPRERDLCAASPRPNERFLQHWTLKEAYLKAQGTGIAADMRAVDMDFEPCTYGVATPFDSESGAIATVTDARPRAPVGPWYLQVWRVESHWLIATSVKHTGGAVRISGMHLSC